MTERELTERIGIKEDLEQAAFINKCFRKGLEAETIEEVYGFSKRAIEQALSLDNLKNQLVKGRIHSEGAYQIYPNLKRQLVAYVCDAYSHLII